MSRSASKERKGGRKYASSKTWKDKQSAGFTSTYLRLPKGATLYQPKAGAAYLDFLPYEVKKGRDEPGGNPHANSGFLYWERTYWIHRNVGPNQEAYVCLAKTMKKPCPICEERARIMKSDPDPEEEKMAKDLLPKERQLFNVREKKSEKGVQLMEISFFNFGERLRDELANADEDDNWDMFFTCDQGKTLKVGWGEDSMGTTKFIRADSIHFKDRPELDEDKTLEETHDLDACLIIKPYEELKDLFLQASAATAKKKGKKDDDEDEEEEDDEDSADSEEDDDEDESPKKKSTKKPSKDDDEDDEEEDEEDSDDEDDDEEDEAPKKKSAKKPAKDEEDDDDSEDDEDSDEEEEEDEDDEEDEKPSKKSPAKKSSKDDDEDDEADSDDDDESEDDDEESDDEDEDDEDEKPVKKGKPAPKKSKDEDEEDEDDDEDVEDSDDEDEDSDDEDEDEEEDDDEDEAPKKKKK